MAMGSSAKKRLRRCVKSMIRAYHWVLDFHRRSFDCQPEGFQYDGAIANLVFSSIPVSYSFRVAERTRTRDEDMEQRFQGATRSNSLKATKGRVMPMGGRGEL